MSVVLIFSLGLGDRVPEQGTRRAWCAQPYRHESLPPEIHPQAVRPNPASLEALVPLCFWICSGGRHVPPPPHQR